MSNDKQLWAWEAPLIGPHRSPFSGLLPNQQLEQAELEMELLSNLPVPSQELPASSGLLIESHTSLQSGSSMGYTGVPPEAFDNGSTAITAVESMSLDLTGIDSPDDATMDSPQCSSNAGTDDGTPYSHSPATPSVASPTRGVLKLPAEIFLMICAYLELSAVKDFSGTNRAFREIALEYVFGTGTCQTRSDLMNMQDDLEVALSSTRLVHVRELHFGPWPDRVCINQKRRAAVVEKRCKALLFVIDTLPALCKLAFLPPSECAQRMRTMSEDSSLRVLGVQYLAINVDCEYMLPIFPNVNTVALMDSRDLFGAIPQGIHRFLRQTANLEQLKTLWLDRVVEPDSYHVLAGIASKLENLALPAPLDGLNTNDPDFVFFLDNIICLANLKHVHIMHGFLFECRGRGRRNCSCRYNNFPPAKQGHQFCSKHHPKEPTQVAKLAPPTIEVGTTFLRDPRLKDFDPKCVFHQLQIWHREQDYMERHRIRSKWITS